MLALIFVLALISFALQYEMTLKMKSYLAPKTYPSQYHQKLNNNDEKLKGWREENTSNKKLTINIRQLDLFMKHLTRAHRFERNAKLRGIMALTAERITRFKRFNNGRGTPTTTQEKRPRLSVTIILNAVNEITDLATLLRELTYQSKNKTNIDCDDWRLDTQILLGLTQKSYDKHSKEINKLQTSTFKYVLVPQDQQERVVNTLAFLVGKVKTENVLLTRDVRFIGHDFNIDEFIRPLQQQQKRRKKTTKTSADVVIASQILSHDNRWRTGCYQSQLIWNQFRTQYGADSIELKKTSNPHMTTKRNAAQLWIQCDYFDGPFAMRRNILMGLLKDRVKSRCHNKVLYTEIAYVMNNKGSVMKLHSSTLFFMGGGSGALSKNDWKDFAVRNDISEVFIDTIDTTTNNNEGTTFTENSITKTKIHHEFDHGTLLNHGTTTTSTTNNCGNKNIRHNMLQPRHCIQELNHMLTNTYRIFNKFGVRYSNEGSSALAAVKIHGTMPWYPYHELAFHTDNTTELIELESEFKKYGIHLEREEDRECLAKKKKTTKKLECTSVKGVSSALWHIKLHAKKALSGDLYKSSKLSDKQKQSFPSSRIHGKDTKVRMGNFWGFISPNPGYYARARYGTDVLNHASVSTEKGIHGKISRHFGQCPVEGHQRCMNQYLSDGNIQFQRAWV